VQVIILIALIQKVVSPDCVRLARDGACDRTDGDSGRRKVIGLIIFEIVVGIILALLALQRLARSWGRQLRRFVTIAAFVLFAAMFIVYLVFIGKNASAGFTDIVLLFFANFTLGVIVVQLTLYIAPYNELGVVLVNAGYYAADTV
jgi:hypothetical protein